MNINKRKLTIKYENSETLEKPVKSRCLKETVFNDEKENTDINEISLKDLEDLEYLLDAHEFNDIKMSEINLTSFQRYIVSSIEREKNHDILLYLTCEKNLKSTKTKCILQGVWRFLNILPGDLLSIRAEYNNSLNCYLITSENGIIIRYPDLLISGTSVVGSLFCLRRGVLADKFRGVDGGNKIKTIGSLIHGLLQTVLKRKLETLQDIRSVSEEILNSNENIFSLYSCQMTLDETRIEINRYLPNIASFIQRYIKGNYDIKVLPNTFSGEIDSIQDIEENVWIPQLGLKGKIDISVKTRYKNKSEIKPMPLEIKTGKASFSNEHKGQIILYQMMLSELGKTIDSGLLLYLKEGIMKEIPLNKNEQRDLILLRNELASYLSKNVDKNKIAINEIIELPEPINYLSACQKCPYKIICCSYLNKDKNNKLNDNHPLINESKLIMTHLTQKQIEYFIKWTGLISLEKDEFQKLNQLKKIWTVSPEIRCKQKTTIMDLIINGKVVEEENIYLHVLTTNKEKLNSNEKPMDLRETLFKLGDFIIVSIKERVAISSGRVQMLSKDSITLGLDRNLTDNYKNELFILDIYLSDSIMSNNNGNLGSLLNDSETANQLRKIIVEKIPPIFINKLPKQIATLGRAILTKLNSIQRKAVLKSITAQNYLLLKGLPGTGKTQTLVAIIEILLILNKTVLVTSHTHSAIDNLLLRLKMDNIPFMRLGALSRMNPLLKEFSETILTENCKSPAQLERVYQQYKIIGVTCHGSSHPILSQHLFDVCVVDESTQVFQPSIIRPLLSAKKFILVGDPNQLPPIIKSKDARNLGADESLFVRLDSDEATFTLTLQYRMNKTITNLANKLTYKGLLQCASEQVANATIQILKPEIITELYGSEKWLIRTLSNHIDQSVILLDTGNVYQKSLDFDELQKNEPSFIVDSFLNDTQSKEQLLITNDREQLKKQCVSVNYCETALTLYIINALIQAGVTGNSIGIISPFRIQVEKLKDIIKKYQNLSEMNESEIEVNTVDQYQGRDKEIIIYSCTKSDKLTENLVNSINSNETEILEDIRRLTVAITRSKHKLIIIGDFQTLKKYTPFNNLFNCLNSICKISLIDGRLGFGWNGVFNFLEAALDKENESFI